MNCVQQRNIEMHAFPMLLSTKNVSAIKVIQITLNNLIARGLIIQKELFKSTSTNNHLKKSQSGTMNSRLALYPEDEKIRQPNIWIHDEHVL